jgi:hypothetical protein
VYRQRFVKLEEVKLDWGLDVEIPELKKQMRLLERVVCYVTRGQRELLMYQPTGDWFLAWPYTFLGDLLEGESSEIAALRLVFQDAGLKLDTPELLGAFQRPVNTGLHPNQLWHFFWLEAPIETPDVLNQDVSIDVFGNSEVIYKYQQQFVKLEDVNLSLGQQQFYPVLWEKLLFQISSFYLSHELERRNKYSNSTREEFGFEFVSFLFSFVFERFHILYESISFWDQNAARFGRIGNQIEIQFTLFENGDKRWSCGCNFQKPNKDGVILNFELRKTNGVYFVYACSDFDYHDHPEGISMDFLVESEIRQVTKTSNPILEAITASNEVIFSTEVINSILDQRIDPQKVFSTYRYLEMKHKNLKALYEALEALT